MFLKEFLMEFHGDTSKKFFWIPWRIGDVRRMEEHGDIHRLIIRRNVGEIFGETHRANPGAIAA